MVTVHSEQLGYGCLLSSVDERQIKVTAHLKSEPLNPPPPPPSNEQSKKNPYILSRSEGTSSAQYAFPYIAAESLSNSKIPRPGMPPDPP